MINQGNNHSFRAPVSQGHSHGLRQLGQLLGENLETIYISHDDDTASNSGLHITQVFPSQSSHANNFFFNNPGQYNISWGSDVSSGRPQAQIGQLTGNGPTSSGSITSTTSAGNFAFLGAGSAASSAQNQGRPTPTPATTNGNGNRGNEPTSSSIQRPPFARVNMAATPNGPRTD